MAMDNLKEAFDHDGVVVLRDEVGPEKVAEWQAAWAEFAKTQRVVGFNPVEVTGPFPDTLEAMQRYSVIARAARLALDDSPFVYNFRFIVKDAQSSGPVFLHQDVGYHIGSLPKLSAFVALSSVTPENGGLHFWLGTHKYGYLGDVGEINPDILLTKPRVICPVLAAGDIVLMDSALWHHSGPKVHGPDRILADIIYMRSDDPSRAIPREGVFVRSRVSRLKEMQDKLTKAGIE